jgi:hypothetical protein
MVEIDWNSLFSRFFGMVRVKIECKDASKIPSKRLFEMKRNMYLIQFKVEKNTGSKEGSEGDGGDNNDPPNNDKDPGVEEIDQDMELGKEKDPREDNNKSSRKYSEGNCSTPIDIRKVMDWVSLFQNCDEDILMGSSDFAQYSCTKLLKEMEVVVHDSEDEMDIALDGTDEGELVRIPENWLGDVNKSDEVHGLPEKFYILPELKGTGHNIAVHVDEGSTLSS